MAEPLVASFGGGVNSTAMLVEFAKRDIRPGLILFADTGAERPDVYRHVEQMSRWLEDRGLPRIETVRSKAQFTTLEEECLAKKTLPSLAYGWRRCSDKYKIRPQDRRTGEWERARKVWAQGDKVKKAIGFDADEPHRAKIAEAPRWMYWYPLIEWDMGREECEVAIRDAGLAVPGKSACFFCPASKKKEVKMLARCYPELYERALVIEDGAEGLKAVKGLGRHWSWRDLVEGDDAQSKLWPDLELPCMCDL